MEVPVLLTIQGIQMQPGGNADRIEFMTAATMYIHRDGSFTLTYEETEMTGLAGTTTNFHVGSNEAEIIRMGNMNSNMRFHAGEEHISMYDTPFGSMIMKVITRKYESTLTEEGGKVEVTYIIEIDNQLIGQNNLTVQVQRRKEPEGILAKSGAAGTAGT